MDGPPADRARDESGRPRSDRPRDSLGRPLPRDADPREAVDRVAEEPPRTPDESLRRAQQLVDEGRPFDAHEVLESAWRRGPSEERDLWQGLTQLCVALTHVARGNPSGARTLFARGATRLRLHLATGAPAHGVELAAVATWAERSAAVASDADLPRDGLQLSSPS